MVGQIDSVHGRGGILVPAIWRKRRLLQSDNQEVCAAPTPLKHGLPFEAKKSMLEAQARH